MPPISHPKIAYRLVHIRQVLTIDHNRSEWRIVSPLSFGISVSKCSVPDDCKRFFNISTPSDIIEFVTRIDGEGGPWEGW